MEYLNKFMSAVSTVKASVDSALPGNPVTREYEAVSHVASAGPGLSWKIFSGYKKSSRKEVSIWLFEKKALENWTIKKDRDTLFEALKSGISQLTRIRHPRCLHVEHPLEESRESLAFCTEPVFASLANVLGRVDNMPPSLPPILTEFSLEKIEVQHGLQELTEALQFLHVDAKILHRNICPESVLITKKDCWKLAGFDFCVANSAPNDQIPSYPFLEWDCALTPFAQPSLNYLAPEYVTSGRCDGFSDVFSFGVLMYAVYNKGRPLCDHNHNLDTFKKNTTKLKSLPMSLFANIPVELKEDVKLCLQPTPELRPDATQLSKIPFFDDGSVKQIQQLESLCQLDGPQKAQFLRTLTANLDNFSKKLLMWKILPFVAEELKSVDLVPFVLPVVLYIAEKVDANEYTALVLPVLSPVFSMQVPFQIPVLLLQKMDLLLSKTPPDEIRRVILPLIYSSLDSNMSQLQEPCLSVLPNVVHLMDSKSIKNQLLPKLLQMVSEVTVMSVKVNALISIGKMLDKLERWMVIDQILPTLSKISSKEPAVLMAILGIFKISFTNPKINITKEVCAKHCIPFLVTASIENSLNLKQFESFMVLIKEMIAKVESEQRLRLQQFSGSSNSPEPTYANSVLSPSVEKSPSSELVPKSVAKPISSTGSSGPKILSLEEKKRLAAEQEQTVRLRNQTPLEPFNSESTNQSQKSSKTCSNNVSQSSAPVNLSNTLPMTPMIRPPASTSTVRPLIQSSVVGNSQTINGSSDVLMPILSAPPPTNNPVITPRGSATNMNMNFSNTNMNMNLSNTNTNFHSASALTNLNKPIASSTSTNTNPIATDWSSFLNSNTSSVLSDSKSYGKATGKSAFDDLVVFPTGKQQSPVVNKPASSTVPSVKNDLSDLLG